MTDPSPEALKRLGELVTARRRDDLGLRQDQLAYGPSTTTMTQIETGEKRVSDLSYRRLDQSLGWADGTCIRVLAGEDPVVVVAKPPHRLDPRRDLQRGPITPEQEASSDFIEQELLDARRRSAAGDAAGNKSRLVRFFEARSTPPEERTDDQWDVIRDAEDRRARAAAAERRAIAEQPLIDLVDDGQLLAYAKNDEDVTVYVRKVESYVVGVMGLDRLSAGLSWRSQERTMSRAVSGGVVEEFTDLIGRLLAEGIEGPEMVRRAESGLEELLAAKHAKGASHDNGARADIAFLDAARDDPAGGHSEGRRLREEQDRAGEEVRDP